MDIKKPDEKSDGLRKMRATEGAIEADRRSKLEDSVFEQDDPVEPGEDLREKEQQMDSLDPELRADDETPQRLKRPA